MSCEIYTNGSNPSLNFSGGNIPPGFCPTSWQEVFNQFWALLIGTFPGSFSTFVIGSDKPTADDQDKLWFRLDAANNCEPVGWFIYHNGNWVRAQPHPVMPGVIVDYWFDDFSPFSGTQEDIDKQVRDAIDLLETDWDPPGSPVNPFWYVCDGTRGTPNLRARFRVGCGSVDSYTATDGTVVPATPLDMFSRPLLAKRKQGDLWGEEAHFLTPAESPVTPIPGAGVGSGGLFNTREADFAHNTMPPCVAIYPIMKSPRRF